VLPWPSRGAREKAAMGVVAVAVVLGGCPVGHAQPTPAVVHPVTADELGATWHSGCPVGPDGLRRV